MESGGPCVMTDGMKMMQWLSVVSLDYPVKASILHNVHIHY